MVSEHHLSQSQPQDPSPGDPNAVNLSPKQPEHPAAPPLSKRLLFRVLSILWSFPTLGAIWIWASESGRVKTGASLLEKMAAITIEQWLAAILIMLHFAFITLAFYHRREKPRSPNI
jgi:hypothetical protein